MRRRENTFRIDYSHLPRKPSYDDLHSFISSVLELEKKHVVRMQTSRSLGCVFVKVDELEIAQRIVQEHDNVHETEIGGKTYKIRITMEDGAVEVKLFDLSEDVSDDKIYEFLQEYGDVFGIQELAWDAKYAFGGISSGIRVAKMIVKTNIPSFVTIDGETTALSYYGQQQTCRHCNESSHSGISCIQNKKLLVQKLDADYSNTSYAKVLKQNVHPKPVQTKPHQVKPSVATLTTITKDAQLKQSVSGLTPPIENTNKPLLRSKLDLASTQQSAATATNIFKIPSQQSVSGDPPRKQTSAERRNDDDSDTSSASTASRRSTRVPPNKKKCQVVGDASPEHMST
ncbi:uncharacterized protein LOC131433847 [Malaya genurostris]|uniref:uncharacterized protein LOC131433847 n=1 Tax=Malaya genurostris TaxID=325434 RepID=UPI0026F3F6A1|nr:uncharacterized protein LOC131433847 [Malaya genurostris]